MANGRLGSKCLLCFCLSLAVCLCECSIRLEGCKGRSITVLDLDVVFQEPAQGRPACYPLTLMVTPSNGKVFVTNNLTKDVAPHLAGAHAAGYYTAEAIRASENYTPHLDHADLVYVNDYCYWAWWLAWLNSGTLISVRTRIDDATPGDFLVSAYEKLMQIPRWQVNKGADFIFFDGHPGFYEGDAKHHIWPMRCGAMQNSIQIVVGMPQRRRCAGFKSMRSKIVVAPLMAPMVDPHDEEIYTQDPGAFLKHAVANLKAQAPQPAARDRKLLLYFRGRCDPHSKNHIGNLMRSWIARHLMREAGDDVHVACLEDEVSQAAELLEAAATYGDMKDAVFCLVLPGSDQATSKVAEAFLSGCIPVFVGPPWHAMPLTSTVAYNSSALFFKVEDTKAYLDQGQEGGTSESHIGAHPQEAQWWTPDMPASELDQIVNVVAKAEDILPQLRKLAANNQWLARKMESVHEQSRKFLYHSAQASLPGGVQAIMEEVCSKSPNASNIKWSGGHPDDGLQTS